MSEHPSAYVPAEEPHAVAPDIETARSEAAALVEASGLGSEAVRRLRALADPPEIRRLLEAHARSAPRAPRSQRPERLPRQAEPPAAATAPRPAEPPRPVHRESTTQWMDRGNCADESPAIFHPADGVGVEVARRICADCPVRQECLEYALTHRIDHGVWGGTSERERRRILKRRRLTRLDSPAS